MNDKMITLLARMTPRDLLTIHLKEALDNYMLLPSDETFQKMAMCSTLVSMKSMADSMVVHELLESLAENTIPFFTASAN